ncbi:MerR family transcriptional regulator [Streptomyces sp. NBC_01264]|uniref:DNA polymerase III subunit beta family protein n=1 Tax=Streptomyces sp. NBC_01264 TaxID=2903804 RepID=UPI002258D6E9|nr:MerR family transcriptional regulator [Streptomyces sp. NBC_01264]MCX4778832.1 MerR family transcriptional regulator [Streptomyces sp. NBC_01264]
MRSIGETALDSGLSVSALRFYDGAGVLVPVRVDPASGYRWYGPEQVEEARLLARLRRTGMPLADIRLVLAGWAGADTDLVRGLLRAHLLRLEQGLSDARTELSTIRALLERRETPMSASTTLPTTTPTPTATRLTLSGPELAAALDAVRFAVGSDPGLPVLGGILFDIEDGALRVVATDRYRLAVARAGAAGHTGPRLQRLVPAPLADAMRALLSEGAPVLLTVDGDRVALETETADRQAAGRCLGHEFPDYRRLVTLPAGRRVLVDVPAVRKALEDGPVRPAEREQDGATGDVSVLRVTDGGALSLGDSGADDPADVGLNRAFLLDALAAGARDQLILELGAPKAPVVIRRPDDEESFSLLMPVRLDA